MSTNYVPAMKAKIGDWTYYITKMKFGDVAREVKRAEQIHPNKELDKQVQREVSGRVEAMTNFLLEEPQRFYGALVVGVYLGNPVYRPVRIAEDHEIVDSVDHDFGLLQFDGSQTFFALDGQHRLASIIEACEQNPSLKSEEIAVIVLKHDGDKEGLQRTRRLFTKLNRYAKATDQKTNIAIDEDDCVAIATRRMVRDYSNLSNIVKVDSASKQLTPTAANAKFLTTLSSLYEFNLVVANSFDDHIEMTKEFLAKRPDEEFLAGLYAFLCEVWDSLFDKIPLLKKIALRQVEPGVARGGVDGGNIWVRPIIHLLIADVISRAKTEGKDINLIVSSLANLPQILNKEPWSYIIWNPDTKKIIGGKAEREFLVDLLCWSLDLAKPKKKKSDIEKGYREYHGGQQKSLPKIKTIAVK